MKKPLLITIAIGEHRRLFRSCIRTQKAYARRCGYESLIVTKSPRRLQAAEASWIKVAMIRDALLQGYEWVGFIDADCDVRTHAPCFAAHCERLGPQHSVYMAPGISGRLNAGVILARRHPEAIALLEAVWDNCEASLPPADVAPYENGHVIHYARPSAAVCALEHREWNNNSHLDPTSFVQHYSGGPLRLWYMEHRAPGRLAKRIVRKARRILRTFGGAATPESTIQRGDEILSGKDGESGLSSRLNTLMDFYRRIHPQFKRTVSAQMDDDPVSGVTCAG